MGSMLKWKKKTFLGKFHETKAVKHPWFRGTGYVWLGCCSKLGLCSGFGLCSKLGLCSGLRLCSKLGLCSGLGLCTGWSQVPLQGPASNTFFEWPDTISACNFADKNLIWLRSARLYLWPPCFFIFLNVTLICQPQWRLIRYKKQ